MKTKFKHNIIAFVYDFDGTLTPLPMQEYTVLPEMNVRGKKFWDEAKKESINSEGEEIVTYMRLMIQKAQQAQYAVTPEVLRKLAQNIDYYRGVPTFFRRINTYIKRQYGKEIKLRHYIISAGLKEVILGSSIAKYFHNIFASEYYHDEYGKAIFPKVVINDTVKTQYLFRINKGMEKIHESINTHMDPEDRKIPFQNILYIGDGLTDVPSMTVTRKNGGYAIAVFKTHSPKGKRVCRDLLSRGRVDFIANADFTHNSDLDRLIKLVIGNMVEGIRYGRESFRQKRLYFDKGGYDVRNN